MLDMGSYTFQDTKEAIIELGHEVDPIYYFFKNRFEDDFFSERINLCLKRKKYDAVLSINFFPLLAVAANEHGIPYISWSYDSPLSEQLTEYFHFDTNRIFLFDRSEVEIFQSKGFKNVYHLTLAVNTKRLNKLSFSPEINKKFSSEISFVGNLYSSPLNDLLYCADDYIKGYCEALFQSQFRIYGCNFVENAISDDLIKSLNASYSKYGTTDIKLTKRGLAYAINSQITHVERKILLESLAEKHEVKFYSMSQNDLNKNVKQLGPVKYFEEMNAVFRNSLLNLCPTLKSISSGIPLRALDILGSGGVLFANYQTELAEHFVDGKDVIMYESLEDAIEKADYYLTNNNLLPDIASAGFQKAKTNFSYIDKAYILLKSIYNH